MMAELARKRAVYEDLFGVPENMIGEILNGELIVTPRPSKEHVAAASHLGGKLIPSYRFGESGGPGGWVILIEPEVKFGEDFLVPDLAGWKRERFPIDEQTNWISVSPDWVCEVLSPSTVRKDRIEKMSIYGRHSVPYYWLIDPVAKILEVLRLEAGRWVISGVYGESDRVRAEPFQEVEIDLGSLWLS